MARFRLGFSNITNGQVQVRLGFSGLKIARFRFDRFFQNCKQPGLGSNLRFFKTLSGKFPLSITMVSISNGKCNDLLAWNGIGH